VARSSPLEAISPERLYPISVLKKATGWGDRALREARNAGLKVHRRHGRCFLLGAEVIAYVIAESEPPASASPAASQINQEIRTLGGVR
jgi:hypothetical protein